MLSVWSTLRFTTDSFKCTTCDELLAVLSSVESGEFGACLHCGDVAWAGVVELKAAISGSGSLRAEATIAEVGQAEEREQALPVLPVQTIAPGLVEQPITAFDPVVGLTEPPIEWPTDEEMDQLGLLGDFVAMGVLLHAPGKGDPENQWIAELTIEGHWDHPFRIGTAPDDAITDAAVTFSEYVKKWRPEI